MTDHWQEITLGQCFTVVKRTVDPTTLGVHVVYVGLEHIEPDRPSIRKPGTADSVTSLVSSFEMGDVLFGRLRPYLRKVVKAEFGGVCSPEILVFRAKGNVIAGFLYLLASSDAAIDHAVALSAGSRMPRTSVADLSALAVALPPVVEQRRIVDLIVALDRQILALDGECQAVEVLLGCLRASLVTEAEWIPVSGMTDRGGIQIGPFGSQLHARDYTANGVPVVMPQDLVRGQIVTQKIKYVSETTAARLARHRMRPGDLVLPRRGDLRKRALVTSEQDGWLCGTGCIRIRLSDPTGAALLIEGLSTAGTDEWLEGHAVGTTMLNLNTEIVSNLPAPRFSEAGRALAAASLAARVTVRGLRAENQHLTLARRKILQSLMTRAVSLPQTYDALLLEAL